MFIGEEGQFAVSRHQGARQLPLFQGLCELGIRGLAARVLNLELTRLAIRVGKYLDQSLGPMGELGLDLAIGPSKQVWLIEVNARPNKDNLPFTRRQIILRPFQMMMKYARYLSRPDFFNASPILLPSEKSDDSEI